MVLVAQYGVVAASDQSVARSSVTFAKAPRTWLPTVRTAATAPGQVSNATHTEELATYVMSVSHQAGVPRLQVGPLCLPAREEAGPRPGLSVVGRLAARWREWERFGAPQRVVEWLRYGVRLRPVEPELLVETKQRRQAMLDAEQAA